MVHYREFAPQLEVAEAVASWPIIHKAAVQTGIAAEDKTAPHGDIAARERIARARMTLPSAVVQAVRQSPPPGTMAAPATPSGERLGAAPGERLQAAPAEPAEAETEAAPLPMPRATVEARVEPAEAETEAAPQPMPRATVEARVETAEAAAEAAPQPMPRATVEPRREAAKPALAGKEQPPPRTPEMPAAWEEPYDGEPSEPAWHHPARDRGALFGGEYRGQGRAARPSNRVADRQDRSLEAVFSRLSGARDRLPDPRARARTTPGLGSVFGQLR